MNLSTVAIYAAVAELCAVGGWKNGRSRSDTRNDERHQHKHNPFKMWQLTQTDTNTQASERMGIAAGGGGGPERQRLSSSCNLKEIGELASLLTLAAR